MDKVYDTPERATGRCLEASAKLIDALRRSGEQAALVQLSGYRGDLRQASYLWQDNDPAVHYMVWVNGRLVDMTARQFDPSAGYPAFYTVDEVAELWARVEYLGQREEFATVA